MHRPPLDYQSQPPPPPGPRPVSPALRLLAGFLAGTALSAAVWIGGWTPLVQRGSGDILWVVPAVKVLASVVCLCIPGWRSFGAGVLASLAIGFLIFFVTCAVNLKM